jgi:hypothetical protein|tara:strand:- start:341 stop:580 length:240 start_codon:yes stop_codon:yes gene_type:complete
MQIKMLQDAEGTINASGNATKTYKKDEIVECDKPWQETLAKIFVDEGFAEEIKITKPTETKKAKTAVKKKKKVTSKKSK